MAAEVLQLPDPVEGDIEGTADTLFFRIGAAVPLTPSCSKYELTDPPMRPLAVSERFGLLFLAHSEGFMVAKTKDVIHLAKEIKETLEAQKKRGAKNSKRMSIQESSIVDVRIGKVSILSLSKDSSSLAATVGGNIQVFSVRSLLRKEEEPLVSCFLDDSGHVKDFQWCQNKDESFIALSTCDSLYHGNLNGRLDVVTHDIKAVDSSPDGFFFVFARENVLSILSIKFDELLQIPISQTCTSPNCNLIVDSVKWIHSDSIILGRTQINDDGEQDGYLVQVISSRDGGFKASSQPTLVSFSDPFHGISDLLSCKTGHLLASYLDRWSLAVLSNRTNIDDHIVLLELPDSKRKEAVCLELFGEIYFPRIELQEKGEDNLILGLDVDKISLHEKLEYRNEDDINNEDIKELSPYCILLCLSSEGKLIMFYIARISDPCIPTPSPIEAFADDIVAEINNSKIIPVVNNLLSDISNLKNDEQVVSVDSLKQICKSSNVNTDASKSDQLVNIPIPTIEESSILGQAKQGFHLPSGSTRKPIVQPFTSNISGLDSTSYLSSVRNIPTAATCDDGRSDSFLTKQAEFKSGFSCSSNLQSGSLVSISAEKLGFSGAKTSSIFGPQISSSKDPVISPKVAQTILPDMNKQSVNSRVSIKDDLLPEISDQENVKDCYSLNDMVKELDRLLMSIEQDGGFSDASTKNSVFALEKSLEKLSQKSRMCKSEVADLVQKVQYLQDKMLQISAWEGYMEGIVKQASNSEYWEVWHRQKLGPEFELKQQQILKQNHALRNQVLELERHFNMLELENFGETGFYKGRKAPYRSDSSRKIQTLHNTVRLQLAAAERLSECLSEQMAALNITSPAVKRHNVAKELLESIGIENQEHSFESPDVKRFGFSPDSAKNIPLSPSSTRQGFGRNTSTAFMSFEPETTRRRRDSLDRSWTNFEPQKTMVKRMSCQKAFKDNVDTGSSYKDSQILTGRTSQCKSFEDVGSLLMKSSVSKVLDHNYSARDEEKPSKKMHDSQPGSMFDSVKVISKSSQVSPKSFDPHTEVTKSSKAYPSLSVQLSETTSGNNLTSGNNQTWTFGTNTLTDKLNLEVSSSEDPDISTSKVASVSSTVYSSRVQSSIIGRSSSEVTETVSPLYNPPIHVYDKTKPAILSSSTAEFNTREKLKKVHPTSPMTMKMLCSQDMSSILPPDLPSSTSLPSSLASAATPFVSQGTQVKSLTTASSISFGGTSDVCKSNTNENVSIVTPQSPSSDPSLQPPISSSPFTFSSISGSSVFQPTPSSDAQASSTSVISSANEKTVLSAASTSAFAGVSSQVQSSLITSTTNIFATPTSSGEISSSITNTEFRKKEDIPDISSHEDEMDEEAPEIPATLGLGCLENFGLGSVVTQSVPKPNPFGGSFINPANTVPSNSSTFSLAIPTGELFKPPSFSLPPVKPMQSPPMINSTGVSSGFGKPAQFGMGQQALGSVLGTFGQTRQLGGTQGIAPFSGGFGGSPAPSASAGGFTAAAACGTSASVGGFAALASKSGGFAGASTGGGFTSAAPTGGGFASAAPTGGGFASLARTGGGFASLAPTGGGFAGASGGGFAGASGGGFSALASGGGGLGSTASVGGGFSGAASGSGRPPAEVLMQMRK